MTVNDTTGPITSPGVNVTPAASWKAVIAIEGRREQQRDHEHRGREQVAEGRAAQGEERGEEDDRRDHGQVERRT